MLFTRLAPLTCPLAGMLMISAVSVSPAFAAPAARLTVVAPAATQPLPIEEAGWRCAYRWHGGCWRHRVWRQHYWRYY